MENKKHNRRLKKLVILCTLCAIIITVSTYAWFIGMKTVNVNAFEINIATTEGLFLSLDGKNWSYTLDVGPDKTAYTGNTNIWAQNGLIPMSTVGDMDSASSTMKLFEKGSLTATPGGYRLLASRVNNYTANADGKFIEGDGYVAFDLFIKNLSGTEYYATNEPLNEEAIYLTTNSAVQISSSGIANTGIENSARVAFVQIGRVIGTEENDTKITGITCSSDTDAGITGICRDAQIWEPNDKAHVQNAINWYETSCLPREGATVYDKASYKTGSCSTVANGTAYKTYAIARTLDISDQINIYDGENYNGYTANTVDYATYHGEEDADTKAAYKLVDYPYFTDTMKNLTSTERPTFMTLAPNSITKLRVYIYIEGQDIDNYDFASLGHQISINFGFTKERYTENDVNYDGPSTDITQNNNTTTNTTEDPENI